MSYLGQGLGLGREERFTATATAGQTTVTVGDDGRSISYTPNYVDVYLNGVKMVNGSDITVTSGTSIVFASALAAGDVVDIVAPGYFQPADTVSRSLGGTFLGPVNFPSGGLNVGSGQLRVDSSGRVLKNAQPLFDADCSSDVAISPNAQDTIAVFNRALRNVGGHYNTTNGRFTAPVAGVYLFFCGGYLGSSPILQQWFVLNGARARSIMTLNNTSSVSSGMGMQYMNANDSIGVHLYNTNTSDTLFANSQHTFFTGYFLG